VVFDRRRNGLYLMRESRNIDPLPLEPAASGIWDGRFYVANGCGDAVQIVAAAGLPPPSFASSLPKGAVFRAAASAPSICFAAGAGPENAGLVTITPRLAPFDRFLTRFDLTLADQLSMSLGRTAYLSPPL
jgi:tRNA(Ile)-lysidine synthase